MADPSSSTSNLSVSSAPNPLTTLPTRLVAPTRSALSLPNSSDLSFYRSVDKDFSKRLDKLSERLKGLVGNVLEKGTTRNSSGGSSGIGVGVVGKEKGKSKVQWDFENEHGAYGRVTDVVEELLERADTLIEENSGHPSASSQPQFPLETSRPAGGPPSRSRRFRNNNNNNRQLFKEPLPSYVYNPPSIVKPQNLFSNELKLDNGFEGKVFIPRFEDPYQKGKENREEVGMINPPVEEEDNENENNVHPVYRKVVLDSKDLELKGVPERDEDGVVITERRLATSETDEEGLTEGILRMRNSFAAMDNNSRNNDDEIGGSGFLYVGNETDWEKMMKEIREVGDKKGKKELAVDLEHHEYRSWAGLLCLMQISTRQKDYIVDILDPKVRSRVHELKPIFEDPSWIKVFHGADSDIMWLHRDFGIYVIGLFDTYHATVALGFPKHSLASLLKLYCDIVCDKRYQRADWRIRPLPLEMHEYARSDTHFLLFIYDQLRIALRQKALSLPTVPPSPPEIPDGAPNASARFHAPNRPVPDHNPTSSPYLLLHWVIRLSRATALNRYRKDVYDDERGTNIGGWRTMLSKAGFAGEKGEIGDWKRDGTGVGFEAVKRLTFWREKVAREEDESVRYVLQPNKLIFLASIRPTNAGDVLTTCRPCPPLVSSRAQEVADVIKSAIDAVAKRKEELVEEFGGSGWGDVNVESTREGDGWWGDDVVPASAIDRDGTDNEQEDGDDDPSGWGTGWDVDDELDSPGGASSSRVNAIKGLWDAIDVGSVDPRVFSSNVNHSIKPNLNPLFSNHLSNKSLSSNPSNLGFIVPTVTEATSKKVSPAAVSQSSSALFAASEKKEVYGMGNGGGTRGGRGGPGSETTAWVPDLVSKMVSGSSVLLEPAPEFGGDKRREVSTGNMDKNKKPRKNKRGGENVSPYENHGIITKKNRMRIEDARRAEKEIARLAMYQLSPTPLPEYVSSKENTQPQRSLNISQNNIVGDGNPESSREEKSPGFADHLFVPRSQREQPKHQPEVKRDTAENGRENDVILVVSETKGTSKRKRRRNEIGEDDKKQKKVRKNKTPDAKGGGNGQVLNSEQDEGMEEDGEEISILDAVVSDGKTRAASFKSKDEGRRRNGGRMDNGGFKNPKKVDKNPKKGNMSQTFV